MRFHLPQFLLFTLCLAAILPATAAADPARGPVSCTTCPQPVNGWWPLDETAGGVAVDAAYDNDGLHLGAPLPMAGKVAGGLDFDGSDDYVAILDADELDVGTGDFTVDAWIRTSDDAGVVTILDKRTDDANGVTGYSLFLSGGLLSFQMADGGGGSNICSTSPSSSCTNYISTAPVADGGWHFVAVTVDRDSASGGVFYVDGSQVGAPFSPTFRSGSLSNDSPLYFARRSFSAVAFFDGTLDEVELFPRALDAMEVLDLFAADSAGKCKCLTAPADLAAWWPFDDGISGTVDEIVAANDGTRVGVPASVAGVVGGALDFDGTNDYVEVPHASEIDVDDGDFSIDFWVRTTDASGVDTILDKRTSGGGFIGYEIYVYNGSIGVQLANGIGGTTYTNYNSSAFVADGEWHFVAVTVNRDESDGLKFYLDGQLVQSFAPTGRMGTLSNDSPLRIGVRAFADTAFLDGTLDELELFKRVLSLAEVQALYAAGPAGKCKCTPAPVGVAAWWPLDEASGTISGELVHGNAGAHVGSPTPIAGKVGGALDFDGTNYVEVPDAPELDVGDGDFSLDLWVRTTDASGVDTILDKRNPGPAYLGYEIYVYNGSVGFELANGLGSPTYTNYNSSAFIADGEWHFIAITVARDNPDGLIFYLDGQVVQDFDPTGRTGSLANDSPVRIGVRAFSDTAYFDGSMDEIELFKRVLTPAEVQALYDAGPAGKCQEDFTHIFADGFESGDTSEWSSTVP